MEERTIDAAGDLATTRETQRQRNTSTSCPTATARYT